ncbi:type VII secretion protein EssB [Fictibacillus phosphorivorans]|uniref:type VII secretion protein EssB n=1 Tax=Fictibacillus phosphorivorans TaxID=1221500 RepID=UPI0012936B1D|nr:type VII secretion protein EssB [Fictibacillus phosphorivorans]MQR96037.1 type VII secretion protein EssB [Fictibacillus phosphorivorans]
MTEKNKTYLEQILESQISRDEDSITFAFQKEKIKLDDVIEVELLKELDTDIQRTIIVDENELKITILPHSNYRYFPDLTNQNDRSKWMFAFQLTKRVKEHSLNRLHLVVCPENIVFDQSLSPAFLHYGVKESIPPYEAEHERVWKELKATIVFLVDGKHSFHDYLKLHETIELSTAAKEVLEVDDLNGLLLFIQKKLNDIDEKDKLMLNIPQKKWKITQYASLGLLICFIPAIIYTIYSLFFLQPRQEAFVSSNEHFLGKEYSEVVEVMSDYDVEDMPNVVQYQLASSYIINESLTEEQKENIQNTVSLQSEPLYFQYWIYIGRGNAKEALDIARSLEDKDLIMFALIKYREELKSDDKLSSEEKQQKIKEVQAEIDEYLEEQEAIKEEEERLKEEERKAEEEKQKEQEAMEQKAKEEAAAAEKEQKPATPPKPTNSN